MRRANLPRSHPREGAILIRVEVATETEATSKIRHAINQTAKRKEGARALKPEPFSIRNAVPHKSGVFWALPRRGRSNDGSQDLPLSRRDSDGATVPPAGTVA